MGYSNCPHWMISQFLVGYPNIKKNNKEINFPFELVFSKESIKNAITEVYPAVAIWLWTLEHRSEIRNDWKYKKNETILYQIIEILVTKKIIKIDEVNKIKEFSTPNSLTEKQKNKIIEDRLDAFIAWKLGREWVDNGKVKILGNNETGSFLLPEHEEMHEKFNQFKEQF